jgi:VWFA-related protein
VRTISRARRASSCLLAIAWLLHQGGVVALAQTPAPEFRAQIELVTLDVVVVDGSGRSVDGLTSDDFVLEEDGQRQEIVNFEAVSLSPEPEARAPEASSIATSASKRRPGRAFAIVADDLRLPGEQTLQVRRTMADFIDKSLGPGDAVVLGTTSGEVWWSARLPEGREDLLAVLDRVTGRYVDPGTRERMTEYEANWIIHREAGSQPDTGLAEGLRGPTSVLQRVALRLWDQGQCGSKEHGTYAACIPLAKSLAADIDAARQRRASLALAALARAVNALASSYGHRSVVFLSPGFLQDEDLSQRDVANAALQTHTAVHFVDTRGLETGGLDAAATPDLQSLQNPGRATQSGFEKRIMESGGALALAEETGGFSARNTNDLAAAAERIAGESRTFYLLGFRPPAGKRAGAWRRLRVAVDRSGVTTRTRPGYRLYEAARAALTRSGAETLIPLRLASYVLEPLAGDRTRVVAVTEVDVSGLGARNLDEPSPPLRLRLEATPRDGGETQAQDVSLQWTHANAVENVGSGPGWRLARLELALPAGVHGIRAFVRDPATRRSGLVEQRIVVPEPTAFRVSTPVLSDQVTTPGEAQATLSPALVAHDSFGPTSARPLLAHFEVFGAARDPATGQSRVETRLVLEDGAGRPLAAPPASPLAPSPEGRLQQLVALPRLPGGEYTLDMTVEDRVAGRSQGVRRRFSVEEPPASAPAAASSRPEPDAAATPELAAILDRASRYVLAYGRELSNVVAEEECRQIYEPDDPVRRAVRNTRAGVLFVTLPGPLPWATFRDVWEVDGNKIRDRQDRLVRLFRDSPASAPERARAILEESARFNLGPVRRTLNIPTLALLFLQHENQYRFAFQLKGQRSFQATKVVEVAFSERARPTLVLGDTREGAPVKGKLWIDPERGTVVKTEAEYDIDPLDHQHRSRARIVTEYRREPALGILVPDRMQETYQSLAARGRGFGVLQDAHAPSRDAQEESGVLTVEATTKYSGYLRFAVTTEETLTGLPEKPQ